MRTNFVLIDFESVQPESLAALVHEQFKVMVFVGAPQVKVPFELAAAMQRMGDKAEYIKIAGSGKNALDFHIAYYLGQLAMRDPEAYFHIISRDGGFDPLIQHLKTKKIFAARHPDIESIPMVQAANKKSPEERAQLFNEKLNQPKASKPRNEKTLRSAIASFFQKKLTELEVDAVVAAMQRSSFITIAESKVSYVHSG